MRRFVFQVILILTVFLAIGVACNGEEESKPPQKEFEPFSFAVITDLHIGYGIPNYFPDYSTRAGFDWLDGLEGSPGKNDNQAEILKCIIERIINEKDRFNIKFVVVLGDISDTAEKSEFLRAREILNGLNKVGIPYIPLIGNHDVWPYTQTEENFNPGDRNRHQTIADYALGDQFFEEIFWGGGNEKNLQLIKNLFGDSWQKSENPIKDLPRVNHSVYLQNYGFSYGGITFITLDLAPRAKEDPNPRNGVAYPGATLPGGIPNPQGALATSHKQTLEFSRNYTKNQSSERNIVILFSHHPLGFVGMARYVILENYRWIYNFAGHQHTTEVQRPDVSKFEILTEDIGEIKFPLTNRTGKPIRIVQVKEDKIDYSELLAKECPISPTFTPTPSPMACPPEGEPKFSIGQEVITTDKLWVRTDSGPVSKETEIKTEPKGTSGKILEGPICQYDYVWWKVKYQDGTTGWSAQDWLEVKIIETVTPIVLIVLTPTPVLETPIPSPTITVTPPLITEIKGKIAFVTDRDGNQEIYLMSGNSANQINLTNNPANDWDPAWSPDGSKIAFVSDRDGDAEIYIMNANGSNLVKLTNNDSGDINPAWFPDGSAIIFARHGPQEGLYPPLDRLYIMNADGSNQREFSIDPAIVQGDYALRNYNTNEPAVSPDGSKIVFTVESWWSGHFPVLYLMNSDGTNVIRFGDSIPNCSGSANWSRNGKRIVFSCQEQDVTPYAWITGIYLINSDGSGYQEILPDGGFPCWSPDGELITFTRGEISHLSGWENLQIYIVRPDGSELRRITLNEYNNWDPNWTPH